MSRTCNKHGEMRKPHIILIRKTETRVLRHRHRYRFQYQALINLQVAEWDFPGLLTDYWILKDSAVWI